MARHLMAVCVVCLLCADHLPCKQHIDYISKDPHIDDIPKDPHIPENDQIDYSAIRNIKENNKLNNQASYDSLDKNSPNNLKNGIATIKTDLELNENVTYNLHNIINSRQEYWLKKKNVHQIYKRHSDHSHENYEDDKTHERNSVEKNSQIFLIKLMDRFGDPQKLTMNVLGLEKMLTQLGLYNFIEQQTINSGQTNPKKINDTCLSTADFVSRISSTRNLIKNFSTKLITDYTLKTHSDSVATTNSTNLGEIKSSTSIKEELFLNEKDLWAICPILLYQITAPTSLERSGCLNSSLVPDNLYHDQHLLDMQTEDRKFVWIYASLSILGISLCGLLGVAVIPCMESEYYNHILQYLVALAVGTLTGDALLHLIPHAMTTVAKDNDPHVTMIYKGLIAGMGIIFFCTTERVLTMITEWRKSIEKKEKPSSRVRVMRDLDAATGVKECKHKYSSYPYCYDEISMDTKDDHHHHNKNGSTYTSVNSEPEKPLNYSKHNHGDYLDTSKSLLSPNNVTLPSASYLSLRATEIGENVGDNGFICSTNIENTGVGTAATAVVTDHLRNHSQALSIKEESYTIILREHESKHHGHSHTHGHVHSPPSSMSAVAWMVIMGDGLHNFTDGMAIGAAFSNSIAGGFSTAIAVFCHELPHELGDFAVLLKAGMSTRQAIFYNIMSSVLSFFGTILGIIIGHTPNATSWIFALAAGTFLYIALVDMMPELTTSHKEGFAISQVLLQLLGISMGFGIMLLIALWENDLKSLFSRNSNYLHDQNHH